MMVLRQKLPAILSLVTFVFALCFLPSMWCKRGSDEWFVGDLDTQCRLARTVVAQTTAFLSHDDFKTGSALFDGEWLFGTYLMAGVGLCQIAAEHPETRGEWVPTIEHCIGKLLSDRISTFDTHAWQSSALQSLESDIGHAAYLGYLNFLLSLYRQIDPNNKFASLNDQISETLVRRLRASPNGLIATYPGEWYPVDNAPVLASVAINQRIKGVDIRWLEDHVRREFVGRYIDPATHLLIQAVDGTGSAIDLPRASGTTLAIFFLGRAFPDVGRTLFHPVQTDLSRDVLGFGGIKEFPSGVKGRGDMDSGPVILGFSFSGTGFAISGARTFGDRRLYSSLYASAVLVGAPTTPRGNLDFLSAGPLGNAILLAMLTSPRLP